MSEGKKTTKKDLSKILGSSDENSSRDKRAFLKGTDIAFIAVVLVIAIVLLVFRNLSSKGEKLNAVIYVDGEKYEEIALAKEGEPRLINISAKLNVVIEVWHDGIQFVSSECPDKICVHSGTLSKLHDTAACMPADVAIVVE